MLQHNEIIGSRLFYVIFAFLILFVYGLLPDSPLSAKQTKMSGVLIGISILLIILYFSIVFCWVKQTDLYGIPLEKTGYYMDRQLKFIIVMQLGIFVLSNILILGAYRINKCIYGLSLTGMYLAVGCSCLLHNMTTAEILYKHLLKMTVFIMMEGIVLSVTAYLIMKKKQS